MESMGIGAGGLHRTWPPAGRKRIAALAVALVVVAGSMVAVIDAGLLASSDGAASDTPASVGAVLSDEGPLLQADQGDDTALGEAAIGPSPTSVATPSVPPGTAAGIGSDPRVVKRAVLSIEVTAGSLTNAFDRVAGIAGARGGFVVSSSAFTLDGSAGAELTLRVPAEQFEATRIDLGAVGEVGSVQVSGEDVSAQLIDLDARLRALRAEEIALTGLLSEAVDVGEVLAVREQVSTTRLEIEQLAAQQASLDDRASFSTLVVSLAEPGAIAAASGSEPATGLARSFEQALDASVAVAGGMVVVVGFLLPLAVLGLLAWAAARVARLRRRPA